MLAAHEGRPVRVVSLGAKREKGVPKALCSEFSFPEAPASTEAGDSAAAPADVRKAALARLASLVDLWCRGMQTPLRASEYASKAWFEAWRGGEMAARAAEHPEDAAALRAAGLEEALEEAQKVWGYDAGDAHIEAVFGRTSICEDALGGGAHPAFAQSSRDLWSTLFPLPPESDTGPALDAEPHAITEEGGA